MKITSDRRGNASVEFALLSLFFFAGVMVALDLGVYVQQKFKLGAAVEQAAVMAYKGTATSSLTSYITTYSGTKATPSVDIKCNGGGAAVCGDGKCSCITASGGFSVVATCGATCSGSSAISGNYMKIVASETYNAIVVPDRLLGGSTMTQSAVVRIP